MSKRFVDTDLWQKEWYQNLTLKEKILVKYIFENCDCAGVWECNFRLASFVIGESVSIKDIENINKKKKQFEILTNGNIFIPDFIKFQYGNLSENCKPHKSIIEKLKKYNLFQRVSKGYPKGIQTLEEKEQEQEEEKEKESTLSFLGTSFLSENDGQKLYGEYNNVCLTKEQYGKLLSLCLSEKLLNELLNSFSVNIEVGKERPYKAELPNAHYERLKSYLNFRKKYPEKFGEETDLQERQNRIIENLREQAIREGRI